MNEENASTLLLVAADSEAEQDKRKSKQHILL